MTADDPAASRRHIVIELPVARRGERLDHALAELLPGQSRAAVQRLLRGGHATMGGAIARASFRVRGGERVEINLPSPAPSRLVPEAMPLDILHEDGDLLVLNKSPGVTVHPGAGAHRGTLVHALLHHCHDLPGIGGTERPGIVHRLDRDTSGVLVIAKTDTAHRALTAQFKARTIRKIYEALVWGRPRVTEGMIDAPIGRHPIARVKMTVRPDGRASRSAYRVLHRVGPVSLVELRPETGRTHQLRVHLRSLGHPVVGDRVYGGERLVGVRDPRARDALAAYHGLALHARVLGFSHPATGEWREFTAPRPAAFEHLLDQLKAIHLAPGPQGGGSS